MHRRFLQSLTLLLLSSLCVSPQTFAADGHFEVVRAAARLVDGVWLVDARVSLELSQEAREALASGVVLTLKYQFEVNRRQVLWPDETIRSSSRSVQLRYLSLSDRYLVEYPDGREQMNYATLSAALRDVGELRDYELIRQSQLKPGERYVFAIRTVLDQENLPGPLQMLAFWRGDFILGSNWYRWTPAS